MACQKISAAGITSVHWLVLSEVELEIIQNLHALGRLPFRVNVVVPQELLEKTVGFKTNNVSVLRFGGATIAADGYLDSKEAALLEPYSDEPKNSGKLLCTEEELVASVAKVLAAGVQPIILAMGDKAIDMTLKVIEQTQKSNVRFRIEQAAVLNKDLNSPPQKTGSCGFGSTQSYLNGIFGLVSQTTTRLETSKVAASAQNAS